MAIPDTPKPFSIRYTTRVTALAANLQQKAKLALPPPDVLEQNMSVFATALSKLKDFAVLEQRSVHDLVADVELVPTWTRLCERVSQRARDFHRIEDYIEARRSGNDRDVHVWLWQRDKLKEAKEMKQAQKRVIRDTEDLERLLTRATEHKEAVGWAILNKHGPMSDLVAKHDALSAKVVEAELAIDRKIEEINEMVEEFIDLLPPSMDEVHKFNAENKAAMVPYVDELNRLVDERDAVVQKVYDYEVARRKFYRLPSVGSEIERRLGMEATVLTT